MRVSLGVKLTLTSTLLVAIVVAFLGYTHADSIRKEHDAWAELRSKSYEEQVTELAESATNLLAVAVSEHLMGSELEPLDLVARQLVRRDERIISVKIANQNKDILADSQKRVDAMKLERLEVPDDKSQRKERRGDRPVLVVVRPILDPGSNEPKPIGLVEFAYDLTPLQKQLADIETERKEAISRSLGFTLKIGLVALVIGALLSLFQGLRYARPIRRLAQTTSRIAQGDLAARVQVQQSDEVGALGHQFNHMAERIQALLLESVAKAELEHELNLAREIQSVLVPAPGTHFAPGIEVAGYYEPASNVGGDFWDLSALPRGRSAILIGDVTGHGVPAAILTATAKGCL
ncbi:MAG: HAMP domain-containing protein, partial [Deltaproteobacteria bacterium]|nr:HAMP domain-containing protein [Deltaproteobacteria bacterium]